MENPPLEVQQLIWDYLDVLTPNNSKKVGYLKVNSIWFEGMQPYIFRNIDCVCKLLQFWDNNGGITDESMKGYAKNILIIDTTVLQNRVFPDCLKNALKAGIVFSKLKKLIIPNNAYIELIKMMANKGLKEIVVKDSRYTDNYMVEQFIEKLHVVQHDCHSDLQISLSLPVDLLTNYLENEGIPLPITTLSVLEPTANRPTELLVTSYLLELILTRFRLINLNIDLDISLRHSIRCSNEYFTKLITLDTHTAQFRGKSTAPVLCSLLARMKNLESINLDLGSHSLQVFEYLKRQSVFLPQLKYIVLKFENPGSQNITKFNQLLDDFKASHPGIERMHYNERRIEEGDINRYLSVT